MCVVWSVTQSRGEVLKQVYDRVKITFGKFLRTNILSLSKVHPSPFFPPFLEWIVVSVATHQMKQSPYV